MASMCSIISSPSPAPPIPLPSYLILPSYPPSSWSHISTILPLSYSTTSAPPTTLPLSQVQWEMCIPNTILPGLIKRLPSSVSRQAATGTAVCSPDTDRQIPTCTQRMIFITRLFCVLFVCLFVCLFVFSFHTPTYTQAVNT